MANKSSVGAIIRGILKNPVFALVLVLGLYLTLAAVSTQKELQRQKEISDDISSELLNIGVVPDAASFKAVKVDGKYLYHEAYDSSGNHSGYGFIAEIQGFQESMKIAGGVDLDLKMMGVRVIEQKETPGIGSKVQMQSEFGESFVGVGLDGLVLASEGGQIDGISGATMSSTAVTVGVRGIVEKIHQEVS